MAFWKSENVERRNHAEKTGVKILYIYGIMHTKIEIMIV